MLAVILDASLRAVVLAAAALAVVLLARKRSAAFRHAVWTVVLLGMLGMPAVMLLAPALPIRVLKPAPVPVFLTAPGPAPAESTPSAVPVPIQQPRPFRDWRELVLAIYAVVAFGLLLRLAIGWLGVRRLMRRACLVEPGVAESSEISVPLTIGSTVLLPAGRRDWDPSVLQAALAHEREHVRRRDWLIGTLAALNRALFWFHPLAWWLERRLAALAEEACDDAAVLALEDRALYAGVLLEMARAAGEHGGRLIAGAPAMAHHVTRRVERILDGALKASSGLGRRSWTALLIAALPVFYGAAAARLAPLEPTAQVQAAPVYDQLVRGQITESEAVALEARLVSDPDDVDARSRLIVHYWPARNREAWRKHVFWLIEHHPEADIFRTCMVACVLPTGTDAGAGDAERAKVLWTRKIQDHGDDARVLLNAAAALHYSDLTGSWHSLQRAHEVAPEDPEAVMRLAELYADSIRMGSFPQQEIAPAPVLRRLDASMVKNLLEQSTDALLLGTTGELLTRQAWPYPGPAAFGSFLLQRARMLEPDNSRWSVLPPAQQAEPERAGKPNSALRIRVGSHVQEQRLIKHVDPDYPALAKQARIQGTVRLQITVSPDGHVADIQLLSGHPLLVPATKDAVARWEYKPTLLNGSPAEVVTQVDVPFHLDPADSTTSQPTSGEVQGGVVGGVPGGTPRGVVGAVPAGEPGGVVGGVPGGVQSGPPRIRVGAEVQKQKLLKRPDPAYPPLARQARIQGIVRLLATIGTDGRVKHLELISGHPLLVPAAQSSVIESQYSPTLLNGSPVEVVTPVDVTFALPDEK
jgi:TonB family protein